MSGECRVGRCAVQARRSLAQLYHCEGFADRRGNAIGEQSPWGLKSMPPILARSYRQNFSMNAIRTPRIDHRMSGEHPVGRRAFFGVAVPSGHLCRGGIRGSPQGEQRTIPVRTQLPPSRWRFCFRFLQDRVAPLTSSYVDCLYNYAGQTPSLPPLPKLKRGHFKTWTKGTLPLGANTLRCLAKSKKEP